MSDPKVEQVSISEWTETSASGTPAELIGLLRKSGVFPPGSCDIDCDLDNMVVTLTEKDAWKAKVKLEEDSSTHTMISKPIDLASCIALGVVDQARSMLMDEMANSVGEGENEDKSAFFKENHNEFGNPLIFLASMCKDTDMLTLLLENGADIHELGSKKRNILHYCADRGSLGLSNAVGSISEGRSRGDTASLQSLQSQSSLDLNKMLSSSSSQLQQKETVKDVLQAIIDLDVDMEALDSEGCTPLQLACCTGNVSTASIFLENNADPLNKGDIEMTPLAISIQFRRAQICGQLLTKRGVRPSSQEEGYRILHLAGEKASIEAVDALLTHEYDINDTTLDSGNNVLHVACQIGNTPFIEELIKRKVHINAVNEQGQSPLHIASQNGRYQACTTLLEHGANPYLKCKYDKTPIHYAKGARVSQIIEDSMKTGPMAGLDMSLFAKDLSPFYTLDVDFIRFPVSSPTAVLKSGYLTKRGHKRKNWKKRWFVLYRGHIDYLASPDSSKAKGSIKLVGIHFDNAAAMGRDHCFELSCRDQPSYYMFADSDADMMSWLAAINRARVEDFDQYERM